MMNVICALCVVFLYIICFSQPVKANVNVYTDVIHYNWDGHNEMMGSVFAVTDYGVSFYYCGQMEADISRKVDDIEVEGSHSFGMYVCPNDYFWEEVIVSYVPSSEYEVTGIPHLTVYYQAEEGYYDAYGFSPYNEL